MIIIIYHVWGPHKERGFLICVDKKGKLSATLASCEGEECEINGLPLLAFQCPYRIQGDFHTHSGIDKAKKLLEKKYKREVSNEEARNYIIERIKRKGISISSPSHGDLLSSIIKKYNNIDLGTTCVGNDVDTSKVECWTLKRSVKTKDYNRASLESETNLTHDLPQEWIKPLFEREIINLK